MTKRQGILEILKDAYPQGYSPIYTSANQLQLWREDLSYRLNAYNEICQYHRYQDKKGYSWHETQCGNSVDLEVSPISNGFIYCPFCAGIIEYEVAE